MKKKYYSFDYKDSSDLAKLSPNQLIKYKERFMNKHALLVEEAAQWTETYRNLMKRIASLTESLEEHLSIAEDARIYGNPAEYDFLCRIH